MATLAESGRPKLDVEISCSSSTNSHPRGLSTAEFSNSRLDPQQEEQFCRGKLPVASAGQDDDQPTGWSTKLSSVPLDIRFDVSVYATTDRLGRLTLHPMLRAVNAVAGRARPPPPTQSRGGPRQPTPPTLLQPKGFTSSSPQHGAGGAGDLGRNNCAKAPALTAKHPPSGAFGPGASRMCPQQLAETDFSTATRASNSGAPLGDQPGGAPVIVAAGPTERTPSESAAKESHSKWSDTPRQSHARVNLRQELRSSCSSPLARSLPKGSPAAGSRRIGLGSGCTAVPATAAEQVRENRHLVRRQKQQLLQQPQLQQRRAWRENCQSAMPRFSGAAKSIQSDPPHASGNSSLHSSHRQFQLIRSLERIVHKLEARSAPFDKLAQPIPWDAAVGPATAGCAASARPGRSAATAQVATHPSPARLQSMRAVPRSNLDVADLRLEYALLHD